MKEKNLFNGILFPKIVKTEKLFVIEKTFWNTMLKTENFQKIRVHSRSEQFWKQNTIEKKKKIWIFFSYSKKYDQFLKQNGFFNFFLKVSPWIQHNGAIGIQIRKNNCLVSKNLQEKFEWIFFRKNQIFLVS